MKKYIKKITLIQFICLVLLSAGILAQEEDNVIPVELIELLENSSTEPLALSNTVDHLVDFHVDVNHPAAGDTSRYILNFKLNLGDFMSLDRGGFAFAFPKGFYLSNLSTVRIFDNNDCRDYYVAHYGTSNRVLFMYLKKSNYDDECEDDDKTVYVDVSIILDVVTNIRVAGDYRLTGLAYNKWKRLVAGPSLSDLFQIGLAEIIAINLTPEEDISLRSGETISFSVYGEDQFGNIDPNLDATLTLESEEPAIGFLEENIFYATVVGQGRVVAEYNNLTDQSGIITVLPGELADILLTIPNYQIVGIPLLEGSKIELYDAFGNYITDYDLSLQPIHLSSAIGNLINGFINDNTLLNNGVIDLTTSGIYYSGNSALTDVVAWSQNIESNTVPVSFSGYDILDIHGGGGVTLERLIADQEAVIQILVQNGGGQTAFDKPVIRATFLSDSETSQISFDPYNNGQISILDMTLPLRPEHPEQDTLRVTLDAAYEIDGSLYTTHDTLYLPLEIIPLTSMSAVQLVEVTAESFNAPHVNTDQPFKIKCHLKNLSETNPVTVLVKLFSDGQSTFLPELDFDIPAGEDIEINFDVTASSAAAYQEVFLVEVFSATAEILPPLDNTTSIIIDQPASLELAYELFGVMGGAVGYGQQFAMVVDLLNHGTALTEDGIYSVTTGGVELGDGYVPVGSIAGGQHVVFPFTAPLVDTIIPIAFTLTQIPIDLNVAQQAVIDDTAFSFEINVREVVDTLVPLVQILSVEAIAMNAPHVNTDQSFEIVCQVANVSDLIADSLKLHLFSDGSSTYIPDKILTINPHDTITVHFDVTASAIPVDYELFVVDVESIDIRHLPAIDQTTLIIVEDPADLFLTYNLFGDDNGVVERGADFTLSVELKNLGEAQTSQGLYRLSTGGIGFGSAYDSVGVISVSEHIIYSLTAPAYDTVATISFELTQIPNDLNNGQPASIGSTSFEYDIKVETISQVEPSDSDLLIGLRQLGTNLILTSRPKEALALELNNRSLGEQSLIQIENITISYFNSQNLPLDINSFIDETTTGFYLDGEKVTTTEVSGHSVTYSFEEVVITPQQPKSLVFVFSMTAIPGKTFTISIDLAQVTARYGGGPYIGLPPIISTVDDEFVHTFTYVLKGSSLAASTIAKNNPFDPREEPLSLSYELPTDSKVEFRVFTLTGEEVYSIDFLPGKEGGSRGENVIEWDGKNNSGYMVMNGIYIASIRVIATGEFSRLKIAVLK